MPSNDAANAANTAMAAAAAAAAQQAADEARRARCEVVLTRDPRGNIADMQQFASCVENNYPEASTITHADKIEIGAAGALVFVAMIVGAIRLGFEDRRLDLLGVLMGSFMGLLVGAAIGLVCWGFFSLVAFLIS